MSPVAVGIIRAVQPTAFVSVGPFVAFRFRSGPRTITPYLYNADGTPADTGRAAITLSASPAISSVVITDVKRASGKTYVLAYATRSGSASDTAAVYDVAADAWTTEVAFRPSGQNDMGRVCIMVETGDAFFYHCGVPAGSGSFYMERLPVDLTTRTNVNTASGYTSSFQMELDKAGSFNNLAGAEIQTDGTVIDPTAYDLTDTTIFPFSSFGPGHFLGERLFFRTVQPLPYRLDVNGPDLDKVLRSSGWNTSGLKSVALNDEKTAFGIFPQAQTASPPSEKFDWIDALPKTAVHGSAVDIRPTDYVSPGSPGTLAELPNAVVALGAAP